MGIEILLRKSSLGVFSWIVVMGVIKFLFEVKGKKLVVVINSFLKKKNKLIVV